MSYLQEYDSLDESDEAGRAALVAQWIGEAPRPFFAELRERRPILRTATSTLVTRYRDVQDVLAQPELFSVRIYGMHMDPCVGPFMLGRDGTDLNYREKSIMRTVLALDDLDRIRQMSNAFVTEAIGKAQGGKLELVDTVGRALPIHVVNDYFGYQHPSYETMKRWSLAAQMDFFKNLQNDPAIAQAAQTAGKEQCDYLRDLVQRRTVALGQAPPTTVVDRLIATTLPSGLGLSADRLVSNLAGLLIGAVETTSQAIVQALREILLRPSVAKAALAAAGADSPGFEAIVWEALRFDPINPLIFRFVERDAVVAEGTEHETRLPAGSVVLACTSSAMMDAEELPDPDLFESGRPAKHYLHFGPAAHECLGRYVGGAMIVEAVRVLLQHGATLLPPPEGALDFKGGPFPESFVVGVGA